MNRKHMDWHINILRRSAILFFCSIALVFYTCASGGADGAPNIVIEPPSFDFSKVEEGAIIKHDFKVLNNGNADLNLFRAYASCGCTTATLSKKLLKPGEQADLLVSIDTAMKQEKVAKLVYVSSNDPQHSVVSIKLLMDVQDPHRGMARDGETKIFSDQHCASCHVARGVGKLGMDLYNADCAMCHGPKAEGAVGPALFGPYNDPSFKNQIVRVTSFGSTVHRSMPGFLKQSGGPLSSAEIDSIVAYLHKLSQARGVSK